MKKQRGASLSKKGIVEREDIMTKTITFNELRRIKDALPDGATRQIAEELGIEAETVRNFFGGTHYANGRSAGIHIQPGPDGGIVEISDTTILDKALELATDLPEDILASLGASDAKKE